MKNENGIYAGTMHDFYVFIKKKIYDDCQDVKQTHFNGYDVGFCHSYDRYDLPKHSVSELRENVQGWFGVKVIDTGFESTSSRQFCSDYYGGGDFSCCDIYLDDSDESYVNRLVEDMLNKTFGGVHSTAVVVWEVSKCI